VRIAIVNDSALAIEALRRSVQRSGFDIAWIARDGAEAVAACAVERPELILMDLRMPVMDGVECTRRIMAATPCPILVVTATVDGNFTQVYDALGAGALDAVNTPVIGRDGGLDGDAALLRKMSLIQRLHAPSQFSAATVKLGSPVAHNPFAPSLVVLGGSTGGPEATAQILSSLSPSDAMAIIIVQHIDAEFAPGLAKWLTEHSKFPTEIIKDGMTPKRGIALVAATNDHLVMSANRTLHYAVEPKDMHFRPSVDVFFQSIARYWPRKAIAAVLTGMGRDGASGLKMLRDLGWQTIAQDEKSSVVYGMPRAAFEVGAASQVLPLDRIGPAITAMLKA
jgi:two-component system, chemotaxis family, response regulator WspF